MACKPALVMTGGALLAVGLLIGPSLEAVGCAVLCAVLAGQKPLRNLMSELRPGHQAFLLAFLVGMMAGQLIQRESNTFPLVAWSMFTKPVTGDPDYYEYVAGSLAGSEVELLARDELFPPPLGQNLMIHMGRLARSLAAGDSGARNLEEAARFDRLVRALAARYNELHPESSVKVVRVWRCTVPARTYHGRSSIRRELLWTIRAP
jgi:hypothetical protein